MPSLLDDLQTLKKESLDKVDQAEDAEPLAQQSRLVDVVQLGEPVLI